MINQNMSVAVGVQL